MFQLKSGPGPSEEFSVHIEERAIRGFNIKLRIVKDEMEQREDLN